MNGIKGLSFGISGIYKIESISNPDKIYIGSSIDVRKRIVLHLYKLRLQNHHNPILQNYYNKYGKNDLKFSLILGCSKEELIKNEQFFLDVFNPQLNICKIAGNHLGRKCSPESIQRIREAKKRSVTPEFRQLMREVAIKRGGFLHRVPITEEQKEKIRQKAMGNKRNLGLIRKDRGINSKLYGIPRSEETKRKSSISLKLAWQRRKQKIA